MHKGMLIIISGMLLLLGLSSCVGKKRYDETVLAARTAIDSLKRTSDARIEQLEYELARNMGANDALLITQNRLLNRLDTLQLEIDRLNDRAQSSNQNFSGQLQAAAAEQARLQGKLDAIQGLINQRISEAQTIATTIRDSLAGRGIDLAAFTCDTKGGQAIVHLRETILFRGSSVDRLEEKGQAALVAIGTIVNRFPVQTVQVVGHTDNQPASRSYDNWAYSALRAVTVVNYLVRNSDLGPSRIIAAGNGEYAPIQSNSSPEGQATNRRITLLIQPRQVDLIRDIGRIF